MRITLHQAGSERAFTMIEIAIALGVIGFALVAIIGILPQGMNVQKDNREDTVISQDAPYFMNAIRAGEMRTNNSYLTNYVEAIIVTNIVGTTTNVFVHTNPQFTNGGDLILSNDMNIVGLLSLPQTDYRSLPVYGTTTPSLIQGANVTNQVTAIVLAMSGSAIQQNHANSAMAFRYQMNVEIDPWNFNNGNNLLNTGYNPITNLYDLPPNAAMVANYPNFIVSMLHEVKLKFLWPILPNGSIGEGRQTYRSLVNGHLYVTNVLGGSETMCFFQPQLYTTNTNSVNSY